MDERIMDPLQEASNILKGLQQTLGNVQQNIDNINESIKAIQQEITTTIREFDPVYQQAEQLYGLGWRIIHLDDSIPTATMRIGTLTHEKKDMAVAKVPETRFEDKNVLKVISFIIKNCEELGEPQYSDLLVSLDESNRNVLSYLQDLTLERGTVFSP